MTPLTLREGQHDSREPQGARRFGSLPSPMQAYVAGMVLAGVGLVVNAIWHVDQTHLPQVLVLLLASSLTATIKVQLPLSAGGSTLSLSYVMNFTAILWLHPWAVTLIAVTSAWSQCTFFVRRRNPAYQTLFSMAAVGAAATGAAWSYALVVPAEGRTLLSELGSLGVAATVYFLVNTLPVAGAVALSTQDRFSEVWKRDFLWSNPTYYLGALLSGLIVSVVRLGGPLWIPVLAVPLYVCFRLYKRFTDRVAADQKKVRDGADLQMAVIEAMALAIEAKDGSSQRHLLRMQIYTDGLGRALGLRDDEIRGLRTAALLHDVGNLAVPEHVLAKPGPLTGDEFESVKAHPRVGAQILQAVPFSYPVSEVILSHHERWDGRGYPQGLKGAAIPLGARILAVVDCFAALLEQRPHRPARSYAEAIATIRETAGTALDPGVVDAFIELLPRLESQWEASARRFDPAETPDGAVPPGIAYDAIAKTHREEHAVNDISQMLGASLRVADVLSLVSARLVNLVPVTSSALFLLDEPSGLFLCRHVNGPHADEIRALTAATADGLGTRLPDAPRARAGTGASRLRSVIAAPLMSGERAVGALVFYHIEHGVYSAEHRRLAMRVAEQAAPVIAKTLVFEQAREQSETDPLTALTNRRGMDRLLAAQLTRAERQASHAAVLLFDVDKLKHINDAFGHEAGDRALQAIAAFLQSRLRSYDVCARYAGDEFVVALGDCNRAEAERRLADIEEGLAALDFEPLPGRRQSLGVSGGAAAFPDDGGTADELIAAADRRMYEEKTAKASSRPGAGIRRSAAPLIC